MATRSLNKVLLIGNLTRDPELKYTPQGTAVCTFGVATNRQWTTEDNQKKEDVEFHNIVAWNRLAEICAEFLNKGKQVYVEGRLSTREWEAQDGTKRRTTEVVAGEVIFLGGAPRGEDINIPEDLGMTGSSTAKPAGNQEKEKPSKEAPKKEEPKKSPKEEEPEDIPF